jgi:cell division protein FtsX
VAVSDRINSVLVPETFLTWANNKFGDKSFVPPARVYLKTIDANSAELGKFLTQKSYHTNKDKTKFGRVKQILQAVVTGLGGFAILVIILAMMLFSFYLQLMIAKSKDNLQLLLTLGYSPGWLSKTVAKKWIPVYSLIILIALLITGILQFIFQRYMLDNRHGLSPGLNVNVIIVAMALLILCIVANYRIIRKLLFRL